MFSNWRDVPGVTEDMQRTAASWANTAKARSSGKSVDAAMKLMKKWVGTAKPEDEAAMLALLRVQASADNFRDIFGADKNTKPVAFVNRALKYLNDKEKKASKQEPAPAEPAPVESPAASETRPVETAPVGVSALTPNTAHLFEAYHVANLMAECIRFRQPERALKAMETFVNEPANDDKIPALVERLAELVKLVARLLELIPDSGTTARTDAEESAGERIAASEESVRSGDERVIDPALSDTPVEGGAIATPSPGTTAGTTGQTADQTTTQSADQSADMHPAGIRRPNL